MTTLRMPRRTFERSQAMTEFALVAPVLLLLTFGIMDFGRALYFYAAAGNAAREAARVAMRASSPMPADADVRSAGSIHFPGAVVGAPGGAVAEASAPPAQIATTVTWTISRIAVRRGSKA